MADNDTSDVGAQLLQSMWDRDYCMLIDRRRMNGFDKTIFVKNNKYKRGGRLKVEFIFSFMETSYELFHTDK